VKVKKLLKNNSGGKETNAAVKGGGKENPRYCTAPLRTRPEKKKALPRLFQCKTREARITDRQREKGQGRKGYQA